MGDGGADVLLCWCVWCLDRVRYVAVVCYSNRLVNQDDMFMSDSSFVIA